MRIFDTVLLDHQERRFVEQAWRWTSFTMSDAVVVLFDEQEKKTLARLRDGNAMTRPVVVQAEAVWRHILAEMRERVEYFVRMKQSPPEPAPDSGLPLVLDPPRLAADFQENLEAGIPEVMKVIQILVHAKLNMHDIPDGDWSDSEEAGEMAVDAIVVRR